VDVTPKPYADAVSEPQHARRKRLGAWYTPHELVDAIVGEAMFPGARSVLDPACGDGRFLTATGLQHTMGVDIDPQAPWPSVVHDNALTRDWAGQQFDLVLGNPPYLNQMSTSTTRGGSSPHGGGPYADAAAEFLALAIRLTRPGGRVGLVLPQSLLSARDAAPIRRFVDEHAALRWMWWSDEHVFEASVRVWAGVWEVGGTRTPVRRSTGVDFRACDSMAMPTSWAALLTGRSELHHDGTTLSSIAEFTADFRDQYYGLVDAVSDDGDGPPLITCGLIDANINHWGARPVKFAKQRFVAPRVNLARLTPTMQRWASARLVPKVLIANQTKRIEAVHDPLGEWLPSVPVITCTTNDPERVLRVLHSDAATQWVHHHAAGSGLGAGTVRLNPRLLGSIPLLGSS
jgi:SAM-dependent methyltransferase